MADADYEYEVFVSYRRLPPISDWVRDHFSRSFRSGWMQPRLRTFASSSIAMRSRQAMRGLSG
jgi:hypothetical protein